jgi:hypothetical protein
MLVQVRGISEDNGLAGSIYLLSQLPSSRKTYIVQSYACSLSTIERDIQEQQAFRFGILWATIHYL